MKEKAWHKDASYTYGNFEQSGETVHGTTIITFRFPNAAVGPLEFTDWLYRSYKDADGSMRTDKNLTAEMLQCYIEKDFNR